MNIKSYFAATVDAAIRLARADLGDEALLLNSRPSPPEARHLGNVEVVFGCAPAPARSEPAADAPSSVTLELAALRRQLDQLSGAMLREHAIASAGPFGALAQDLAAAGIAPDLIARAVAQLDGDVSVARDGLATAIASLIAEPAAAVRSRMIAVIGPAGAGKTTALVKLAIREGIAARQSGVFLSADGHRIGAADQLRTFAAVLGIPFESAPTERAAEALLPALSVRPRLWIDTPGLSPADGVAMQNWAGVFRRNPEVERHLVLPAIMGTRGMQDVIERFACLQPTHLLFTHLDEAVECGPLINHAARSGLPVSFLSTGTRIPDDFIESSAGSIGAFAAERIRGREAAGLAPLGRSQAA